MKAYICLDDNRGMLFNNRRQSRDKTVIDDILSSSEPLYISDFSARLFDGRENVITVKSALHDCPDTGRCFVENEAVEACLEGISELVIYHWNRSYPYDTVFSLDLKNEGFTLSSKHDFAGFSHEKITKEVWVK